jgi:hypothetical protein
LSGRGAPALGEIVLIAAAIFATIASAAADIAGGIPDASTKAMMPGCRAIVQSKGAGTSADAAFCSGTIDALLYLGELLPEDYCYAVPLDLPRHRVVEIVLSEIEAVYSSVEQQLFKGLAIEVLRYYWPCRSTGG